MTGRSDLDLDFATLTSVTGYSLNDFRSIDDANATFQGLAQLATGRSDVGAISYFSVNSRKFSQELRLVSRSEEHTSELQSLMRISYAVFCLKKKIST